MSLMKYWALGGLAAGMLMLAGCERNEAVRFGYKGMDLEDGDSLFFTVGDSTNWVPARVLSVGESYEFTEGERKLVEAAGVVDPGEEFLDVPDGYVKQEEEPWFTTWTRPAKSFGFDGTVGFVSHFDEDRKTWLTSESYFSSYWQDEAGALEAFDRLRTELSDGYGVKKFYDFDHCWVAEYRRLRVMAVVGQKADGRWSCMLDIVDKNRSGCGQWEPVEEQQKRRNRYLYAKATTEWHEECVRIVSANYALIAQSLAEDGLPGFPLNHEWRIDEIVPGGECGRIRMFGDVAPGTLDEVWEERLEFIRQRVGLSYGNARIEQVERDGRAVRSSLALDSRYTIRLDVMQLPPSSPVEGEGPFASSAEEEGTRCEWCILCMERMQPGFALPKRPEPVQ